MQGGECLTFLHYFSGPVKFGLGEAISAAAARRGIKVRVINRDILRDGTDLLADEPFSSDFTAALNGHFDGFHSGFPCSSFSRARFRPGGPPPARNRQHLRGCPSNSRVQLLEAEKGTLLATRSAAMVRAVQLGRKKRGLRCTATLENPADPGVDSYPSAWLLPAFASIILEADAVQAIHNICCFGPPHWKKQCWVGFLPGLETFEKKCCCKVTHVPLFTKAATRSAASYPPQLCVEYADQWLDAMTSRDAKLTAYKGSAWIESASIKRICVSAAQVKERRQGSRNGAPCWWLAADKPDFVHGSWNQLDAVCGTALTRHCARQRHRCVQTDAFVWASRFPGSTVRACRKGSKSNSKRVPFGTSRNAQAVLWVAQQRLSGCPLWSDACSWRSRCKHSSGLGCTA